MSKSILFYNVIDEEMFNKMGYTSQPLQGSYVNEENEDIQLTIELVEGQENAYQVVDPKVHWDPAIHNLILQQEVEIANSQFLFGVGGLVSEDAVLGLAYRWYSKESSLIKVKPVKNFTAQDFPNQQFDIDINVKEGSLRGRVAFEVILYRLDTGAVLGILEKTEIFFDGDASTFPIVEVNQPDKPLWWVRCDFSEPLHEQFREDNVAIVLNMSHRQARQLRLERGIGSSPLLVEVIASGLQIIIERIKSTGDWELILKGEGEPGSIGEALYYFIDTFSWDISSPEQLAISIREDFDARFK